MTAYEIQKIEQAIIETETALERAKRYSVELQDHDLIKFYNGHIATLKTVLAAAELIAA